ncbi:MAG TPA: SPW repeat protein [Thermomicrobiaceae bacterium]|nr:SPW repeat protein [Thermomicrobiaceae bacterium]
METRTPLGPRADRMRQMVVASGINLILGLWLIIAPFVLGFSGQTHSEWNSVIIGILVATIAAIRIWGGRGASWLSWINAGLALWLIVSPWIYGNSDVTAILWNDIIVGAVILVLSVWSALAQETLSR